MGEHMGRIALAAVVLGLVACTGGCVVAGDDDEIAETRLVSALSLGEADDLQRGF